MQVSKHYNLKMTNPSEIPVLDDELIHELSSKEWIYEQTPEFTHFVDLEKVILERLMNRN